MRTTGGRLLLLTVGTGRECDLESSLYIPAGKSLREGTWSRVILLCSQGTWRHAEALRRRHADLPIEVLAFPEAGVEENPDACFALFESAIQGLRDQGWKPSQMTADFTRGTKAMSAGLVLAAVSHGVKMLRYVSGPRGAEGTAIPGLERPRDLPAEFATARRRLEQAARMLAGMHFAAALKLGSAGGSGRGAWPSALQGEAAALRWLAGFWGAWDRFDFAEAAALADQLPERSPRKFKRWLPTEKQREFAGMLAEGPPAGAAGRAEHAWRLCADLLENAGRRLALGEMEDALLRGCRVMDLAGQAKLLEHGLDPENLDPDDPRIRGWIERGGTVAREGNGKRIRLTRQGTADFLVFLNDPAGYRLRRETRTGPLRARLRNSSLLVHGMESHARTAGRSELGRMLAGLRRFLLEAGPGAEAGDLEAARFPFASAGGG